MSSVGVWSPYQSTLIWRPHNSINDFAIIEAMWQIVQRWQHRLVLLAACLLMLSPLVGAPVMAWVHADGTLCQTCPREEATSAPNAGGSAVNCCPRTDVAFVQSNDCQVCCEAQTNDTNSLASTTLLLTAIVPATYHEVAPLAVATRLVPSSSGELARHCLRSPPSLRAPPSVLVA